MDDALVRRATRAAMTGLVDSPYASSEPVSQGIRCLVTDGWIIDPELAKNVNAIVQHRATLQLECKRLRSLVSELRGEGPCCVRCGCTEGNACEGGCHWQPNPRMLDLCSSCINRDGTCPTPGCGEPADRLLLTDYDVWGWILLHVHGSVEPRRWLCSPWCAEAAITAAGAELAAADQAAAAGGEH